MIKNDQSFSKINFLSICLSHYTGTASGRQTNYSEGQKNETIEGQTTEQTARKSIHHP